MYWDLITTVLLVAATGAGVVTDLRSRTIPNWISGPACAAGWLAAGVLPGPVDIWSSFGGTVIGGGVLLIFYMFGAGVAGGDVKLMAAVGALKGWLFACYALVYMGIAGGVLAIGVAVYHGDLRATLGRSLRLLLQPWKHAEIMAGPPGGGGPPGGAPKNMVPYAVAIAAGAMAALADWYELW